MTGLVLSAIIVTEWLSTTDFAYSTNAKLIFLPTINAYPCDYFSKVWRGIL